MQNLSNHDLVTRVFSRLILLSFLIGSLSVVIFTLILIGHVIITLWFYDIQLKSSLLDYKDHRTNVTYLVLHFIHKFFAFLVLFLLQVG